MKKANVRKRNRLIALSFVSVLLLLVYGPLAQWFVAADRLIYDQLAGKLPTRPLSDAYIISIDPQRTKPDEVLDQYGALIEKLQASRVGRIILPEPPEVPAAEELPGWAMLMASGSPVFVPSRHRFAEVSPHSGFVNISADSDGVLRRSSLWHLNGGVMSPSLPLAVALYESATATAPRMSSTDDAIFFSNYTDVQRLEVTDVLGLSMSVALNGATVFIDSDPALVGAAAVLPSGQFVTNSELTAAILADIENDRMVISPAWVKAMEWLAPVLLAIVSVLFMPDRDRREIAVLTMGGVLSLLLIEILLLLVLHVRIDLGRPIIGLQERHGFSLGRSTGTRVCGIPALRPVGNGRRGYVQTLAGVRAASETRTRRSGTRMDEANPWPSCRRQYVAIQTQRRTSATRSLRH